MTDTSQNTKYELFEYLVYLLEQWKNEIHATEILTKLRLQKILFFAAAINVTDEVHPLLDIFDKFYAMPYGPVELQIYERMKKNEFKHIKFKGIECQTNFQNFDVSSINAKNRQDIDYAVQSLKGVGFDYLSAPVYTLVEITHKWSAWRIAMDISKISGSLQERMTTEDICNSVIKAFM